MTCPEQKYRGPTNVYFCFSRMHFTLSLSGKVIGNSSLFAAQVVKLLS